jgi:uncharacterized protein YaiL (DUF2058 family)
VEQNTYGLFSARGQLAARVESKKKELLARDKNLSERDAFMLASKLVTRESPQMLQAYREA